MEVDSGRQREFESKLAEVMQQLRQDHEHQLQEYKEEMHRTFSSRVRNTDEAFKCSELARQIWLPKYKLIQLLICFHVFILEKIKILLANIGFFCCLTLDPNLLRQNFKFKLKDLLKDVPAVACGQRLSDPAQILFGSSRFQI